MLQSKKKVLIVDDDPVFQAIAAEFMQSKAPLEVLEALDGAAAIDMVRDAGDTLALIVLDLNMPDLNGIELIQALGETCCRVPLLIVTGAHKSVMQSAAIIGKGHGLKIVGNLKKPVNHADLWLHVAGILYPQGGQTATAATAA